MKKIVIALTAAAAMTGSALAADMAPRTYTKAPVAVAPVASWTGCYIAGGGGYGMWNQENTQYDATVNPRVQNAAVQTNGGRGYFGTVQGGCDYQFSAGSMQLVVGGFGDYDFASMKGQFSQQFGNLTGEEKLSSAWSAGGRIGVVALPGFLAYFSAGYTESTFDRVNLFGLGNPVQVSYFDKATYKGYFIGAGDEYALSFMPGLFWKTEYRFSDLDTKTNLGRNLNGTLNGDQYDSHKYVHTIRSELVYRFNWGGPVVAKY